MERGDAVQVPRVRVGARLDQGGDDPGVRIFRRGLVQGSDAAARPGVHLRARPDEQGDDFRMRRVSRRDEEGGQGEPARVAVGIRARPEALADVLRRGRAEEVPCAPVVTDGRGGRGRCGGGRRDRIRRRCARAGREEQEGDGREDEDPKGAETPAAAEPAWTDEGAPFHELLRTWVVARASYLRRGRSGHSLSIGPLRRPRRDDRDGERSHSVNLALHNVNWS